MRPPLGSTAASPATTASNGTPFASATAAASVAFTTWCAPRRERQTGPDPQGDSSHERRSQLVVEPTDCARTSA